MSARTDPLIEGLGEVVMPKGDIFGSSSGRDDAMRELNEPITSWSSTSLAAIAVACACAIWSSVESFVTRPRPCDAR